MPWVQLMILPILIFVGLIFFLRYLMTRNITSATGYLQELSKHYTAKEEEINKRLKESRDEAQNIVMKAKKEADELKSRSSKEINADKENILKEARQRSEEMVAHAERTCESLKSESMQKMDQHALEKACELIQNSLPDKLRQELHLVWMKEIDKTELQLERLNLSEDIKEVNVVSAFPLTRHEKEILGEKLKKKLGANIGLKEALDPKLVAGFMISVGSIVVDASLKYKIQSNIKHS